MLLFHGWLFVLLHAAASEPVLPRQEVWEAVYRDTIRIGYVHTIVETLESKDIRASSDLNLTFRRASALVGVRMVHGTEDSPAGKVIRVFMRQYQGDKTSVQLNLNGNLTDDGRMRIDIDSGRVSRILPWSDDVLSLQRREAEFASRKPKPGDHWTQLVYEPIVNTLVTYQVTVREPEEVSSPGPRQTLLRVELKPDPLPHRQGNGTGKLQLPSQIVWLDDQFVPVRRQIELEGLGPLTLLRTTRVHATAPLSQKDQMPDINTLSLIPLQRKIDRPYRTQTAVYKITLRDDADPGTALVQDEHQEIRSLRDNTFELHVHPTGGRTRIRDNPEPGAEYLASNYYIDSADGYVVKKARDAVGDVVDPWVKCQRIERWVKDHMTVDSRAPLVPAGKVAFNPRGDCRHYAFLTTAMCRSQKIPARTAIGLIYMDRGTQPPALGFHMWTEVWINGQWRGLDATLGLGAVSAAHLKITHHSWNDTRSLTPLLPVTRVLGKLRVEVIQAD